MLDKKGHSIPDAKVELFVNGAFAGICHCGNTGDGTVYTFQVNDPTAVIDLAAEYNRSVCHYPFRPRRRYLEFHFKMWRSACLTSDLVGAALGGPHWRGRSS